MPVARAACSCAFAAAIMLASPGARAAPDEIQVYTDEMDDPGQFGVELHLNYVPKGEKTPPYPGAMPSNHVTQLTPEFSYGITKSLEAGLYLPAAISSDGTLYGTNGARVRLKFLAPRDDGDRFFWGLNTEFGYFSRRVSESRWGMELRPIIGYRSSDWLFSFNPILEIDLGPDVSREPRFAPALKLSRTVGHRLQAGFEYYGDFGPIHHRIGASERAHALYGALDAEIAGVDVNFGIGRGYVNAGDIWVVKAIISLPFN